MHATHWYMVSSCASLSFSNCNCSATTYGCGHTHIHTRMCSGIERLQTMSCVIAQVVQVKNTTLAQQKMRNTNRCLEWRRRSELTCLIHSASALAFSFLEVCTFWSAASLTARSSRILRSSASSSCTCWLRRRSWALAWRYSIRLGEREGPGREVGMCMGRDGKGSEGLTLTPFSSLPPHIVAVPSPKDGYRRITQKKETETK